MAIKITTELKMKENSAIADISLMMLAICDIIFSYHFVSKGNVYYENYDTMRHNTTYSSL
ncbi:MAG: hypothetical protein FJ218_04330 [Ignavibacteria bacterium]|nr:hypothetical protein [Ignavibacteria bacterium]